MPNQSPIDEGLLQEVMRTTGRPAGAAHDEALKALLRLQPFSAPSARRANPCPPRRSLETPDLRCHRARR
jgi:hypothetical protein